jgi:hypothetical protein
VEEIRSSGVDSTVGARGLSQRATEATRISSQAQCAGVGYRRVCHQNGNSRYNIAAVFAPLADREQAFASLEEAYAAHSWYSAALRVDPDLDSQRPDPRFADLARRVGLPRAPVREYVLAA